MKGLIASVFKSDLGDCSNGGISGKVESVVIVNCNGPFDPSESMPAVEIRTGNLPGTVKAIPVEGKDENKIGWMFGGTFIYTSDSRFPYNYPVPLHDRQESQELNEILSR